MCRAQHSYKERSTRHGFSNTFFRNLEHWALIQSLSPLETTKKENSNFVVSTKKKNGTTKVHFVAIEYSWSILGGRYFFAMTHASRHKR